MPTVDANIWVSAFDASDYFHVQSAHFLRETTDRGIVLYAPAFALVEVACVVARKFRDPPAGVAAADEILNRGLIQIVPIDEALLKLAMELGSRQFLRGGDALYAATAQLTGSPLLSWDYELIQRVGAVLPTDWLDANP